MAVLALAAALPSYRQTDAAGAQPRNEATDSGRDGAPDLLRLDDARDRDAFRRWFAFLAEVQYFSPAGERPAEIVDCAALVRYAYREALRRHDTRWAISAHLPVVPAFDSVRKYNFPHTPVGPALFRLGGGAYGQFANAETLERFNAFLVTRDVRGAQRGDLLFFRRFHGEFTFHSMIFVGQSQIAPDGSTYAVYHTGPDGGEAGEIRRLSMGELLRYPDPQWRPVPENANFLGVFRWNILRTDS